MARRTLAEHKAALLDGMDRIDAIEVLIADATGSMLAESLVPDHPLPPVDIATCDGYALLANDVATATADKPVTLAVSHDVSWSLRTPRRHVGGTAARISSGAPVPTGADAVIPVGATDLGVAKVSVNASTRVGSNVRKAGADAAAGKALVPAGTRLGAQQLGLAAMLGRRRLSVYPTPRVVILAVGKGLTDPGARGQGGGTPESNSHALAVMVVEAGAHAYRVGSVQNDRIALRTTIEDQLVRADLVLTTGGLSGAKDDTLPDVLRDLGSFEISSVALMPGRRHGHGHIAASVQGMDTPVIALPGHPAAALTAFELYVRPVLRTMAGHSEVERRRVKAKSADAFESPAGAAQCVPVLIDGGRSQLVSHVIGDPWQPALADMAQANALAVIPEDVTGVKVGDPLSCIMWSD